MESPIALATARGCRGKQWLPAWRFFERPEKMEFNRVTALLRLKSMFCSFW